MTRAFSAATAASLLTLALHIIAGCASKPAATAPDEGADGEWNSYGEVERPLPESTVKELRQHDRRKVSVSGTIEDVCLTMGCWLNLRDRNGDRLFVMMRDHEYFVPRNAAGREVLVNGTARSDTFTVAELRHLAEDAGASKAQIAAIAQPEHRLYFIADGVQIRGPGLDPPAVQ